MPTSFTVGSESDLDAALAQVALASQVDPVATAYTITATSVITLATDLDPISVAAGDTVDITGDALTGPGGITVDGPGRVILSAAGTNPDGEHGLAYSYTGNTTLDGGTLELALKGPLGDGGHVVFNGPAELVLDVQPGNGPGAFSTVDGFAPGDVFNLRSLFFSEHVGLGQNPAAPQNVFIFDAGGDFDQLDITGAHDLQLSGAADMSTNLTEAPCFVEGTMIATPLGEIPVEALAAGDHVTLASGGSVPVHWVGHRRVELWRHPHPEAAQPVRIRASAFGPGLPRRDLRLSPEHALLLDGFLVPVHVLIDGEAVVQEAPERVTYYHVELDHHGVLLAEGLPVESYLDTGNRHQFANGAIVGLHPDFAQGKAVAEPCAPLALCGPVVEAQRARLQTAALSQLRGAA